MAYLTEYKLQFDKDKNDVLDYIDQDRSLRYLQDINYAQGWFWVGEHSWYDHEKDMKYLSLQFPDILFTLEGWGEDEQVWRKYFREGKMQVAEATVTFPDFDPEKLQ